MTYSILLNKDNTYSGVVNLHPSHLQSHATKLMGWWGYTFPRADRQKAKFFSIDEYTLINKPKLNAAGCRLLYIIANDVRYRTSDWNLHHAASDTIDKYENGGYLMEGLNLERGLRSLLNAGIIKRIEELRTWDLTALGCTMMRPLIGTRKPEWLRSRIMSLL